MSSDADTKPPAPVVVLRVIHEPSPQLGVRNMAIDEALLDSAAHGGPTLRWYRWSEPTLSLGYFQSAEDRPESLRSLPWLRRQTGGGAILHDAEWTYSLTLPTFGLSLADQRRLVDDVHRTIAEVLRSSSEALPSPELHPGRPEVPHGEPFLCFERRSAGDLVAADSKVLGSAQRRKHGALLQHGSLLLRANPLVLHLKGVADLGGVGTASEELPRAATRRLSYLWKMEPAEGLMSETELQAAEILEREKYSSLEWNLKR